MTRPIVTRFGALVNWLASLPMRAINSTPSPSQATSAVRPPGAGVRLGDQPADPAAAAGRSATSQRAPLGQAQGHHVGAAPVDAPAGRCRGGAAPRTPVRGTAPDVPDQVARRTPRTSSRAGTGRPPPDRATARAAARARRAPATARPGPGSGRTAGRRRLSRAAGLAAARRPPGRLDRQPRRPPPAGWPPGRTASPATGRRQDVGAAQGDAGVAAAARSSGTQQAFEGEAGQRLPGGSAAGGGAGCGGIVGATPSHRRPVELACGVGGSAAGSRSGCPACRTPAGASARRRAQPGQGVGPGSPARAGRRGAGARPSPARSAASSKRSSLRAMRPRFRRAAASSGAASVTRRYASPRLDQPPQAEAHQRQQLAAPAGRRGRRPAPRRSPPRPRPAAARPPGCWPGACAPGTRRGRRVGCAGWPGAGGSVVSDGGRRSGQGCRGQRWLAPPCALAVPELLVALQHVGHVGRGWSRRAACRRTCRTAPGPAW